MSLLTWRQQRARLSQQSPGEPGLAEMIGLVERDARQQCPNGLVRVSGRAERRRRGELFGGGLVQRRRERGSERVETPFEFL